MTNKDNGIMNEEDWVLDNCIIVVRVTDSCYIAAKRYVIYGSVGVDAVKHEAQPEIFKSEQDVITTYIGLDIMANDKSFFRLDLNQLFYDAF